MATAIPTANVSYGQTVFSTLCCWNSVGLRSCSSTDGVTFLSEQVDTSSATVRVEPADMEEYDAQSNYIPQTNGMFVVISGFGDSKQPSSQLWIDHYEVRVSSSATFGQTWTPVGMVSSVVFRGVSLSDGTHVVEVRAVDKALQVSETVLTNITVDTVAPILTGECLFFWGGGGDLLIV